MTPAELSTLATVLQTRREADFEEKVTVAWLSEVYHRTEKLPPLQECLQDLKPKEKTPEMEVDEMKRMAMMLNAQFGGTVIEGKSETDN